MPKRETVSDMTAGQMKELSAAVLEALPTDMPADVAQGWISNKRSLKRQLRRVLMPPPVNRKEEALQTKDILDSWAEFYVEAFGIELDITSLKIPERREGFDRLLVIAQGITCEQVCQKCKLSFGAYKYTDSDLDSAVPTNDRTNKNGAYAIWVRERPEADQEWQNHSADQLKEAGIKGITLLERLIYELKYFKETGKHLDINNVTLCSGSRSSRGVVPSVDWHVVRLFVHWCYPVYRYDSLRTREVVPVPTAEQAA